MTSDIDSTADQSPAGMGPQAADRLAEYWVYGALPLAVLLVGLTPFVDGIATSVFLALPAYMIHQFEEHDADRFRAYVNAMLGSDRRGLGHGSVWVINVIFVWFLLLACFYAAGAAAGWGVIAAYLMAINGAVHILATVRTRQYNPGLTTSVVLFFPLSFWILVTQPATVTQHIGSAVLILLLHAGILFWAIRARAGGPG
ncbi:MAG: HXXEE domain-containing protein [Pseudomonadota bacterium]